MSIGPNLTKCYPVSTNNSLARITKVHATDITEIGEIPT